MKLLLIGLGCLGLIGCAGPMGGFNGANSSTPSDFINSIAKDSGANCFSVSIPVYGGGFQGARAGSPGTKISMQGGSCTIETLAAPVPAAPTVIEVPAGTAPVTPSR